MSSTTQLCYLECVKDGDQFSLRGGDNSTYSNGKLTAELPKELDSLQFCIDFDPDGVGHELAVTWKLGNERAQVWSTSAPPGQPEVAGRYWSPVISRDEAKERLAKADGQGKYPVPVALVLVVFGPVTTDELTGEIAETAAAQVLRPPCTVFIRPRLDGELIA